MRNYPAKLLLYGEHILLLGGSALSVPVSAFSASWQWQTPDSQDPFRDLLLRFAASLDAPELSMLNRQAFERDLQQGLALHTNIPVGYGLGSSGALCAAVYDRYCQDKTTDPVLLKQLFGRMESFFHGSSSGIDPLTSYLSKPVLIRNKTDIETPLLQPWKKRPVVFLIDSGMPRQTSALVEWFLDKYREKAFGASIETAYRALHEALVQSWLDANEHEFWKLIGKVSEFQFSNFVPMVPRTLSELWKRQLNNNDNDVWFKICGAGGGGFLLGFSQTRDAVNDLAKHYQIRFPFDT